MKKFEDIKFDFNEAKAQLAKFKTLVNSGKSLAEAADLQPFFDANPHFTLLIGWLMPGLERADKIAKQFELFGDFKTDISFGNEAARKFCFIELEDMSPDSVFTNTGRYHPVWSQRFLTGLSQLMDWEWKLDSIKKTSDMQVKFGADEIDFFSVLIIGHSSHFGRSETLRLNWLMNKFLFRNSRFFIYTYDQLAIDIEKKLEHYKDYGGP